MTPPTRYRKKRVEEVEAIQWTGENTHEVFRFVKMRMSTRAPFKIFMADLPGTLKFEARGTNGVKVIYGWTLKIGYWLVDDGYMQVHNNAIFEQTYERVEERK